MTVPARAGGASVKDGASGGLHVAPHGETQQQGSPGPATLALEAGGRAQEGIWGPVSSSWTPGRKRGRQRVRRWGPCWVLGIRSWPGCPGGRGARGHCPGGRLRSAPTRPPGSTSGTGPGAAGHLSGVPLRGSRRSLWDHLSLRAPRTVKRSESGPVSCHLLPAKQRGHHVTTSHGWPPPGLLCGWGLLETTHWDPAAS